VVQQWTLLLVSQKLIQTAMIIAAALIEGIGFCGFILLINLKNNSCNGWL
jgi:F0F1-type ATP synthase membrane subunit c/vacuolar-type H+-ATPase subunit K